MLDARENLIRLRFRFDCASIPPGKDADMEKYVSKIYLRKRRINNANL